MCSNTIAKHIGKASSAHVRDEHRWWRGSTPANIPSKRSGKVGRRGERLVIQRHATIKTECVRRPGTSGLFRCNAHRILPLPPASSIPTNSINHRVAASALPISNRCAAPVNPGPVRFGIGDRWSRSPARSFPSAGARLRRARDAGCLPATWSALARPSSNKPRVSSRTVF